MERRDRRRYGKRDLAELYVMLQGYRLSTDGVEDLQGIVRMVFGDVLHSLVSFERRDSYDVMEEVVVYRGQVQVRTDDQFLRSLEQLSDEWRSDSRILQGSPVTDAEVVEQFGARANLLDQVRDLIFYLSEDELSLNAQSFLSVIVRWRLGERNVPQGSLERTHVCLG